MPGWRSTLHRIGIGLSMIPAALGLAQPPATNEARVEQIDKLYQGYRSDFPDVPEVSAPELQALLAEDKVVLVDVRTDKERTVSMIPGAIPADAFDPSTIDGKPVVAYCTIGYRSGTWAAEQRKKGVDARNFKGSVLAWSHAGGDFVNPAGEPTHQVHVYGATWDLLRLDYTSVF